MTVFALVAGYIGWRRATKPIYRRTYYTENDLPDGVSRREHDRALRRRRKRWRLVVTLLYAVAGALAGIVFLLALARH